MMPATHTLRLCVCGCNGVKPHTLSRRRAMDQIAEGIVLTVGQDGQAAIDEAIGNLIGETVCVSYTTTRNEGLGERRNFEPQISVQGELEGSKETGRYRVLVDNDTYSYFYAASIWCVGQDVGKRAVVFME